MKVVIAPTVAIASNWCENAGLNPRDPHEVRIVTNVLGVERVRAMELYREDVIDLGWSGNSHEHAYARAFVDSRVRLPRPG